MKLVEDVHTHTGELYGWSFHCPGCEHGHMFFAGQWRFNGDYEKPTFSPSLLNRVRSKSTRCHLFVRKGMIEFLSDCTHKLAGKTVPIEPSETQP